MNYDDWNEYHPIIRATLLHGELVKIHPFIDGNGRTFNNEHGFNEKWICSSYSKKRK